jgi:hypothetical protein
MTTAVHAGSEMRIRLTLDGWLRQAHALGCVVLWDGERLRVVADPREVAP